MSYNNCTASFLPTLSVQFTVGTVPGPNVMNISSMQLSMPSTFAMTFPQFDSVNVSGAGYTFSALHGSVVKLLAQVSNNYMVYNSYLTRNNNYAYNVYSGVGTGKPSIPGMSNYTPTNSPVPPMTVKVYNPSLTGVIDPETGLVVNSFTGLYKGPNSVGTVNVVPGSTYIEYVISFPNQASVPGATLPPSATFNLTADSIISSTYRASVPFVVTLSGTPPVFNAQPDVLVVNENQPFSINIADYVTANPAATYTVTGAPP